jgi:ssDNA-binding replication factor A large subunit
MMIFYCVGGYLTCRTSEIKNRQVSFDLQEVTNNMDIGNVLNGSTSEDTINITGRVVKLNPIATIMKYDNLSQQKVAKSYRTAVIGDLTGAVLVSLWEDIAKNVSEDIYMLNDAFIS